MKFGRQDRSEGVPPPPDAAPPPETATVPQPRSASGRRIRPTPSRIGSVWIVSILFAVVLLLLLIFILENGQRAEVSYFGAHGHLPVGVALLLAAVFGILLVALPGSARILQLRMRDRRRRKLEGQDAAAEPASPPAPTSPPDGNGAAAGVPAPPSVDQAPSAAEPPSELDGPR